MVALIASVGTSLLLGVPVFAASNTIVISQVQVGTAASASNELIELYNNSAQAVDISNWCLYYASSGQTGVGSKLACFTPPSERVHLFLPNHSFALAISNQLAATSPTFGGDLKFSATLAGTAGHVRLMDASAKEVDKVGWGVGAVSPESTSATVPTAGTVLARVLTNTIYQDTDNNSLDFQTTPPRSTYSYGSIYEIIDVCVNITGLQQAAPDGYSSDVNGVCTPPPADMCPNMVGFQQDVPDSYLLDSDGNCQQDVCSNRSGLQMIVPAGYRRDDTGNCWLDLLPLQITELLPNASGSDEGHEFIELYNPNDQAVDLSNYVIWIGTMGQYHVNFMAGDMIEAHGYKLISNKINSFTLVNTTGIVVLKSSDDQLVDQTDIYDNPKDDESWALFAGEWQYSNQPTPGAENLGWFDQDVTDTISVSTLKACAANQYRSPETNRCRTIEPATTLAPCKDGQYRSEETNRCRSVASDAKTYAPCDEGEERNPETNRCRQVVSTSIPKADYAVLGQQTNKGNNYLLWAVIGLTSLGVGYAVWEWRNEIAKAGRKALTYLRVRK